MFETIRIKNMKSYINKAATKVMLIKNIYK